MKPASTPFSARNAVSLIDRFGAVVEADLLRLAVDEEELLQLMDEKVSADRRARSQQQVIACRDVGHADDSSLSSIVKPLRGEVDQTSPNCVGAGSGFVSTWMRRLFRVVSPSPSSRQIR